MKKPPSDAGRFMRIGVFGEALDEMFPVTVCLRHSIPFKVRTQVFADFHAMPAQLWNF